MIEKFGIARRRRASDARTVTSIALKQRFDRRTFVLGAVQGGVGLLLAVRLGYLAIFENEKYRLASESNRVNLTLIPPRRGWMLDRHGAPLASNRADFRVDLMPDRLVDPQRTVAQLGELLQLTPIQMRDLSDKLDKAHGFHPVEVADRARLGPLRRGQRAPARSARRGPAARLLALLPDRPGGRPPARLCRPGIGRRI